MNPPQVAAPLHEAIFKANHAFSSSMEREYHRISQHHSEPIALEFLQRLNSLLHIHDIDLPCSASALKKIAHRKANQCAAIRASAFSVNTAYEKCNELVRRYYLHPPQLERYHFLIDACLNRLCCSRWWFRNLSRLQNKTLEIVARDLGIVQKFGSAYSSPIGQQNRRNQKIFFDEYASNTFLYNDAGQSFSLKELHDKSVANPANRRAELMTRIRGFEEVAMQYGHVAEFYTITAPSRMHARLNKNGKSNTLYDGTTPDEAHQYLCNNWECARSKFSREGLYVYGFRIVEPNHDGTPHWHLLLFMQKEYQKDVRAILKHYALKTDAQEKGAKNHRFKAIEIDRTKGSAAGYIAKYIAKNIDGAHLDQDLYGNDAQSSAHAIDTWASRFNIRQFQQIGGPSVTVWRELRRLSTQPIGTTLSYFSCALSDAMNAAHASDWAKFVIATDSINLKKSLHSIKPYYETLEQIDISTGEILPTRLTAYGDPAKPQVRGITFESEIFITHCYRWTKSFMAPGGDGDGGVMAEPHPPPRRAAALDLYQ